MFAARGASVVLTARRTDELADAVAEIEQAGGAATALRTDIACSPDVEAAVAHTVATFERLDYCVNNAGTEGAIGPVTELEQKVAANPLDHQARFDLATALNASGQRAEATEQLIAIVRKDRKWNEDGARKQLVQLFEAWGPADEATIEGRKRLSTILFS